MVLSDGGRENRAKRWVIGQGDEDKQRSVGLKVGY